MKHQMTIPSDGTFTGNNGTVVTQSGDTGTSVTQGHFGAQSENDYTQMKRQMTMPGDGMFSGISIPSPMTMEGDGGGSQTSGFPSHDFAGFNLPSEASGPAGPNFAPSNGMPTSGPFPGFGDEGKGGFGRRG